MANKWWIHTNFNPWKKNICDCAIRAVVAATGLNYKEVCRRFGVSYVIGKGLRRDTGIDLEDIKKTFKDYFGIIQDFSEDIGFVPDEYKDSKENDELIAFDISNDIDNVSGLSLNDFCEMYLGQGTFLVSLSGDPSSLDMHVRDGGHIVCAKLGKNAKRKGFIDTWDSGNMRVDAYMRVDKTEPKDSPLHWKYDYENNRFIV